MSKTTFTIDDKHLQGFISEQVEAGHFASENDVVETAMQLFERNARMYHQKMHALRESLSESEAQADRGELVDGAAFMDNMLQGLGNN